MWKFRRLRISKTYMKKNKLGGHANWSHTTPSRVTESVAKNVGQLDFSYVACGNVTW